MIDKGGQDDKESLINHVKVSEEGQEDKNVRGSDTPLLAKEAIRSLDQYITMKLRGQKPEMRVFSMELKELNFR